MISEVAAVPVGPAIFVLAAGVAALQFTLYRSKEEVSTGNNPNFKSFQKLFFIGFVPALVADWLQGPYLYRLYSHYGFQEAQIGVLYVCGFATTVILSPLAPIAADSFGRKKICLVFMLAYSLSCLMKCFQSYGILIIGRILSGLSTSLLFYAFDTWYSHEHCQTHDFPTEWIALTYSKLNRYNAVLAAAVGFVAYIFAEPFKFGPLSPFIVAIPILLASGGMIAWHWPENYGNRRISLAKSVSEGLQTIAGDEAIFALGATQALFESVLYIAVFLWTPVLEPSNPPYGLVFACFMMCNAAGETVFRLLQHRLRHVPVAMLLLTACLLSLLGSLLCFFSTHPGSRQPAVSFIAFLLIQYSVGMYFPAMSQLRSKVVPEGQTLSVTNIFRVPLHLITCVVLLLLHEDAFQHGNRWIFCICSCLAGFGVLSTHRLNMLLRVRAEREASDALASDAPLRIS